MHDLLKNWENGKTDWIEPVFSHAPLLMLTVDHKLMIVHASQYLLDEFGYKKQDVVGQKLTNFIGESTDTIWPQLIVPSLKNDFQIHDVETEFCTATGKRVPVLYSAASTRSPEGNDPAVIIAMTQHHESSRTSDQSNESAKEFFRTVNHELRTPMNAIIGMNALLLASSLDDQQRELSTKIQSASEAMMLLIDSLADDKSAPEKPVELVVSEFELRAFVDTISNHWLPIAADKGLLFKFVYETDTPLRIRTDAKRLAQVINSLVGNAIKRTSRGTVGLQVSPVNISRTGSHVIFSVLGSDDKDQSILSANDLAASRDLCLKLGATLEAKPVNSGEELYTVSMPSGAALPKTKKPSAKTRPDDKTNEQFSDSKVLVVEDNQLNQALLRAILENIGINCHMADSGEQAVTLCEQHDYDLIFMDIQMPGMNGVTTAKTIRNKLPHYEYCPIIAVTANALKNAREEYLRDGMDGYIAKPYSPNDIRRITAQIVSNADENTLDRDVN